MPVIPVLVQGLDANLYPDNEHRYDDRHNVVGANKLRVAMTMVVPSEPSPERADLERGLLPEHVRPGEPYGLGLLESQIYSAMILTDAPTVERFQAGGVSFRAQELTIYAGWPTSGHGPWDDIIPHTTWHPGGVGILDKYAGVDGATVTLYEYRVDKAKAWNDRNPPSGEMANMVSWHCDRCHSPSPVEWDEQWENRGPMDRTWASTHARRHARGLDGKCQLPDGKMEQVVSEVASRLHNRQIVVPPRASSCAAEEGCARVRLAAATTSRLVAATTQI